ncbi:MAG: hypothetical protein ACYS8X_13875 [Planctomycetota bacterium]
MTSDTTDDQTAEVIGLLCRWGLLALAAALVAVVTWVVIVAGGQAMEGHAGSVVCSDALWMRDDYDEANLQASADPRVAERDEEFLLSNTSGEELWLGRLTPSFVHIRVAQPTAGVNRVHLQGIPYSRRWLAEIDQPVVLVLPRTDRVWVLDMGVFAELAEGRPGVVEDLLAMIRRRGRAVWVYCGPTKRFVRHRRWARGESPDSVVLHLDTVRPGRLAGLRTFMRRSNLRNADCMIVTGEEGLARSAAFYDRQVHLIGPAGEVAGKTITRHESLANFKEYLVRSPITTE